MTQALHRSWYLRSTHKVWIQTADVQIWEVRGCFPDFRDDIILDTQIKNMNNRLRSKVSWLRLSDGFFGDFKALWIAIIEICLKTNGSLRLQWSAGYGVLMLGEAGGEVWMWLSCIDAIHQEPRWGKHRKSCSVCRLAVWRPAVGIQTASCDRALHAPKNWHRWWWWRSLFLHSAGAALHQSQFRIILLYLIPPPFQRQLFSDWLVRVNSRFEPQMGGASLYDITQMQE